MSSFFNIGQECMPVIKPASLLADNIKYYQGLIDRFSVSKENIAVDSSTQTSKYQINLDLSWHDDSTSSIEVTDESGLSADELNYKTIYLPCDAKVTFHKASSAELNSYGILGMEDVTDPDYSIYPVLIIEPLPHIKITWTKYAPLALAIPSTIYFYGFDEDSFDRLAAFFVDSSEVARDSDHMKRYYEQYKNTVSTPKPDSDLTYANDLLESFLKDETTLILRGGVPLCSMGKEDDSMIYKLYLSFTGIQRPLTEDESDAFFTYRQRIPFERNSASTNSYGFLAGHPLAMLIKTYNQASDKTKTSDIQTAAKLLVNARFVDSMVIDTQGGSKYNNNGIDVDHVDYDYHPNAMFLRAKQTANDLIAFPDLISIDPYEYISGTTIYNADKVQLYFEVPTNLNIGNNSSYLLGTTTIGALTTTTDSFIYLYVLSQTSAQNTLMINIRYNDSSGPIILQLLVQVFEPRFVKIRSHVVESGSINDLTGGTSPAGDPVMGTDLSFNIINQGDGKYLKDALNYINLSGSGNATNTLSRFGNIFLVSETNSTNYNQPELAVEKIIDGVVTDDLETFLVEDYVHIINNGDLYSVLFINQSLSNPLNLGSSTLGLTMLSSDFLAIINYYDQDISLNYYFIWNLSYTDLGGVLVGATQMQNWFTTFWHRSRGRTVVLNSLPDTRIPSITINADFLSLVMFHEGCHRLAMFYGTNWPEGTGFITYLESTNSDVLRFVHPMTVYGLSQINITEEHENFQYNIADIKIDGLGIQYILGMENVNEKYLDQFYPGNIMGPDMNNLIVSGISARLTYKQAMALNDWLK